MAPKYASKRGKKKGKTTKKNYSMVIPPAIKGYVRKQISTAAENKILIDYQVNQSIQTARPTVNPRYFSAFLDVSTGVTNSQRVGNEITPKVNMWRAYLNVLPDAPDNVMVGPIMVRYWVVKYKLQNGSSLPSNAFAKFFSVGAGYANFQANMLDMVLPVNKEEWIVYEDKKFKIGVGANTGVYQSQLNAPDNSSFNRYITVNFMKYWKSKLKFDDSKIEQNNTNMYIVFQAVRADGTSGVAGDVAAEMHYTHTYEWEDL